MSYFGTLYLYVSVWLFLRLTFVSVCVYMAVSPTYFWVCMYLYGCFSDLLLYLYGCFSDLPLCLYVCVWLFLRLTFVSVCICMSVSPTYFCVCMYLYGCFSDLPLCLYVSVWIFLRLFCICMYLYGCFSDLLLYLYVSVWLFRRLTFVSVCICMAVSPTYFCIFTFIYLCFIAKILEKLVLSQVSSYLNSHNLYNTCQSAYRPGHSTETALLKVVNDLFLSLNKGNISVLALLDFSSAFDTIDHNILVHRLHTDFGFTDTVLQWFSSYLTDRTHYVSLCNHCSDFAPVHSGVPQGSVLGPILFTMYIKPLSAIIDSHSIIHHSFADDLQLQMSAPPDRISELLHSMQSCISDVKAWATVNMLRLNDSKTELMLVTSKRSKHLHNLPTSITIGNAQIPFKQSVKNLGFTLDCHLTMNAHVSNIARTCYFELRRLAYIRRFLTSTATATLVSAFVLSRIDYCNSLLFGSTLDVTSHLQRIQNYAARVILRLPMSSRITIHLKSLHWLPVKVRSTYKIACLCYHCHSSTAPSYVTDMLHKKPLHTRNTRSSSYTMPLLNRPAHSKATLGDRSFSFASSSVWNSIPNDVKCAPSLSSFKSRLKTYLFRSVYKD